MTEPSYDDLIAFARAMYETAWRYEEKPTENVFDYLSAPHKWQQEYDKWRELGGTLDKECLDALDAALNPIPKDDDND